METNPLYCTRTGRTISEKTMEDGNISSTKDDKHALGPFINPYVDRPAKLTANGHEESRDSGGDSERGSEPRRASADASSNDAPRQRINPLRIHLGKRPFVDNSLPYNSSNKRKRPLVTNASDSSAANTLPRVPKLIPKKFNRNPYHNVSNYPIHAQHHAIDSELDKPVPRLIPKSQLSQFKKGKIEKGPQLKEYAQSLGLQPMVKYKCRKCCSMSFPTLPMLKEHQSVCRAQSKEPALTTEATNTTDANAAGPSRVTRKVYLCSACGTYYENWNLFLHMREVHNRHICLFCLGMFSKAEKLSSHLTNKHNVQEYSYNSMEDFFNVYSGSLYLMCCNCDEICSEQDDFFNHDCNNVKPKPVPVLISKSAAKCNKVKISKNSHDLVNNGIIKSNSSENKVEAILDIPKQKESIVDEIKQIEDIYSSESLPAKDNAIDSGMELESSNSKAGHSPTIQPSRLYKNTINGDDDGIEPSDESNSSFTDGVQSPVNESKTQSEITLIEKEVGIKLKLSLSSAKSPVIINSTVDPSIGKNLANKPPPRSRKPPKRYEKAVKLDTPVMTPVKTPTIKMTICDKADSPFVKSTIIENDIDALITNNILNNNLEKNKVSEYNTTQESVTTSIKSTIYDNKQDDENTLNRVPKLTVRLPKELLDKDSSSDYSSDSDVSDKLTVDENQTIAHEENTVQVLDQPQPVETSISNELEIKEKTNEAPEEKVQIEDEIEPTKIELKTEIENQPIVDTKQEETAVVEEIPVNELTLDKPLDKYPLKDLMKVFLSCTVYNCIYCNHARKIAVNCEQLALHMAAQHRFSATVNSITAEELLPETITARVTARASESSTVFINLETYDSVDKYEIVPNDYFFECFQCYFKTAVHKDLYLHNRKMHQKTIMLCVMCKSNFSSYSELLCHLCPGMYDAEYEVTYRCCLCNVDTIPSSFRLMVHLRKIHHTCDVCLEFCQSQNRLSNHVWKHKLHHLCYRCGIAYRNKPDITNHLFWKHGTESVLCKRCLQKKWPHVYHFCTPPAFFNCDECSLQFTKAVYLKVHKRFHANEYPHPCTEEGCTEKFVSKKLLSKHEEEHRLKLIIEDLDEEKPVVPKEKQEEANKEPIAVIDLVEDKPDEEPKILSDIKTEGQTEQLSKKTKKKKSKDKDALLLDVNLPALNLSESDSSDASDNEAPSIKKKEDSENKTEEKLKEECTSVTTEKPNVSSDYAEKDDKSEVKPIVADKEENNAGEQQIIDIWDNFKKYQAENKHEKLKEKTPPLVPIRKHVCESDHDYCLIPTELNGDDDMFSFDKKKKKSPKKKHGEFSSSSSSSSDSDSSCSCGSNCSCSSSSGSSSSSSSDSDSSDSGREKKQKKKKGITNRRVSNGSNVDVMGMADTPVLIPEKSEPPIAETDLETNESETDEEFYDGNPQKIANLLHAEKRNQLMLLAGAPTDGGTIQNEVSRSITPVKEELRIEQLTTTEKPSSSKKKSKKKKKSKSSRKHGPIKINIPKDIIAKSEAEVQPPPLAPNKITISLQSNTVQMNTNQIPELINTSTPVPSTTANTKLLQSAESKRASKRRRIPNRFYGYSSDEDAPAGVNAALKPQQPPKLEWRKEDLPSPATQKPKREKEKEKDKEKELPSTIVPQRFFNYTEPIRLKAPPMPDPEPPRILMNTESLESSDSDTSDEGGLEICQPSSTQSLITPPTYLNSGTSSLPYAFQRPAVRQAREGESVYCYCRCPYDEVSEMIACDAEGCPIEWFHFECVGIMVPPKGKWYCPECRKNLSLTGYR